MTRPVGLPTPSEPLLLNPTEQPKAAQPAAPLLPPPQPPLTPLEFALGIAGTVVMSASSSFVDDDGNVQFIATPPTLGQTKPPDSPPPQPER